MILDSEIVSIVARYMRIIWKLIEHNELKQGYAGVITLLPDQNYHVVLVCNLHAWHDKKTVQEDEIWISN